MNTDQLLHPENLSTIELVRILQSLCVSEPLDSSRSHIIEIFKKVAMPLPQRNASIINANGDVKNKYMSQLLVSPNGKRELPVDINEIDQNIKKMKLNSFPVNTKELYLTQDKLNDLHISNMVTDERQTYKSKVNLQEMNLRQTALKRKFLYEFHADRKQIKTSYTTLYADE